MSDVDAVRLLASEYNLEFVDLDRYNVDPSAAGVLSAKVARKHHVVPIGRKFGAPVIAISNPGDVMAMDTLRATIGREFISVVAVGDQIDTCLDRIYSVGDGVPTNGGAVSSNGHGAAVMTTEAPPITEVEEVLDDDPLSAALDDALGLSVWGVAFAANAAEVIEPEVIEPEVTEPEVIEPEVTEPEVTEPEVAEAIEAEAPTEVAHEAAAVVPVVAESSATPDDPDDVSNTVDTETGLHLDPVILAEGEIQQAEAALMASATTESPPEATSEVENVELAADLVEEAVAEFEHSGGDTSHGEPVEGELADFPPLARVLVEGERVPLAEMRAVLDEHDRTGQTIARVLTAKGLVTEADLMWGMAQEMGLGFRDLELEGTDLAAAFDLPENTARHHNVLVIGRDADGNPIVAASNPTDVFAMDDLRTIIGRNFVTVVATRSQINAAIEKAYHHGGDAGDLATTAANEFGDDTTAELENIQVVDDAPIVRYVNLLVLQALNERASDIHIEPTADSLRIRYRIDGVLHDMSTAPRSISPAVTTRLKVMAEMNIAEHRIPQDGRISLNVGNRGIDLRMATLPTIYGEKIVMRVLDKSNVVLGFEDLGFDGDLLAIYERIYTRPYGTILVTGPTGSGKTTTLYATLAALNSPEKNIITVEDPVELRIKGINQVQLNLKAGLTFASALKSILRSDPDIVLVGEIRDRETALISVEASLTGHLVLATLHTNDAASTPMRLVEMGLEPYLVTSAVTAALAQRLARRLCPHCKEPYEPSEADIVAAGWKAEEVFIGSEVPKFYHAAGCSACSNTGYRGRKALLELLVITEDIERMIIEGGTADDIHKLSVEQGMVTLRESGLRKAMEGETTLEEVLRVVA